MLGRGGLSSTEDKGSITLLLIMWMGDEVDSPIIEDTLSIKIWSCWEGNEVLTEETNVFVALLKLIFEEVNEILLGWKPKEE